MIHKHQSYDVAAHAVQGVTIPDRPNLAATCLYDGCDAPIARNRRAYCGDEHAAAAVRSWWAQRREGNIAQGLASNGQPRSARLVDDDIDTVAVELACNGHKPPLNRGERRLVVRLMTDRGLSSAQIGELAGVCARTVVRDRKAMGLAEHIPHLHGPLNDMETAA